MITTNYIRAARKDKELGDEYFSKIPSIKSLSELNFSKPITFFMGENGSGKSTLLEAIAVAAGFNILFIE